MTHIWGRAATAAACAMVACGAASASCVVGRIAELTVTMSGLQPYANVKINGVEVRMLTDSGAFFSNISPGSARELKLRIDPTPSWFYVKGVGGIAETGFTTVKEFTLDGVPLHNIQFLVGGSEVGASLSGYIGRNVLSLADAEYDLANGAIRLMRPSGCGDRPLAYWAGAKGFGETDLLPDGSRNPAAKISVFVNGVKLRAIIDSGASTSLLFLNAAKRAGVAVSGSAASEKGSSMGVGRHLVEGYSAPLTEFKIGDEAIKNTQIRVLETNIEDTDMLLGADFLLSHRVYVANGQKKLYFTYNGGPVFKLTTVALDSTPAPEKVVDPLPVAEPTDADGYSRRGQAFLARRDFVHAMADLDRAVSLAPANADYIYQRALAHLQAGQVFLGMADIDQTLKLRPGDNAALLTRAELKFMGHEPAEAIKDIDQVAKSAAPSADLRLRVAGLYNRAGRMDDAVAQYGLWLSAHPDDARRAQALNGRCWARALLNTELDRALADCNGALRENPKAFAFLDSRGLVFLRRGDFAKAKADYDASLAIQPKSAWSLYGRGLAKLKSGDAAGGQADLEAAKLARPAIAAEAAKYGVAP